MLIEFRVENHRSIREEQGLTLQASNVDGDTTRIREVAGLSLLPAAAIYGANASGKTNVLAALQFMRDAITHSHRFWAPGEGVPREPFAWGPKRSEPSLFQAEFLVKGVRHEYGFVVDDTRVLEEWLKVSPHGRPQTWFERDGDTFKFGEHLKGENRAVEQLTRENSLFLSAAAQNNHEQLEPIYRWFRLVDGYGIHRTPHASWFSNEDVSRSPRPMPDDPLMLQLLRTADVGIVDIRLVRLDPKSPWERSLQSGIQLQHRGAAADAWLPLEEESHGTRRLFRLGPLIIGALTHGGVVMIDELESGLHPLLALEVVRTFQDPKRNPHNAQLLFSTHDTNLLGTIVGEPTLRRDQVWLTEKDDDGGTRFYPMTDYKPRKSENLERGYLQGRYGAIPFLNALQWTGET